MTGFHFESNVPLDIINPDAIWQAWSEVRVEEACAQNRAFINPIICAELAPAFASREALDRWLDSANFQRLPLPYEAGWRASQAFTQYRRAGGARTSPPPDFFIGAHVELSGLTLVTRERARYATYFPALVLITP